MTWTTEQQQVIDTRGRNLLVAAAAGSGKTAVLVERIIQMVTDPEHPVDIDRLLVMTFTNAAAAEMRERIGEALEKRLEEYPGDRNLERQSTLIHHAKITTIDSFCLHLLREHFNELDIDPGFRIGDEGELMLLQTDVMKELLEDYYGRNDEKFFRFVDTYASGKTDGGLEDYIMQVYKFSQSNPWPAEWIAACRAELDVDDPDPESMFRDTAWMQYLLADVRRQAEEFSEQLGEALELAQLEDGPQAYLPMLMEDKRVMDQLAKVDSYNMVHKILSAPLFGRLSAVRGKNVDPEKK
ncbi:MAG: UvrD-helicase domain-containing protein, partial [Lachnospiraceae bacterium]|nr:UvrD-helicase domain-containing protein [Lachnospiraceae bacterium]